MIAKLFLSNLVEPVYFHESGTDVLYHLDENHLHDMPVVEGHELVGTIAESDVYTLGDPDLPLKKQKITLPRNFIYESQHIFDVFKIMADAKITVLPVLDEKEKYIGCIFQKTLVERLARIMAVDNPGAIIILEVNQHDYVLSEIAKFVESQDSKILTLFVTPEPDSTKLNITIKLNVMEIQALLQTFNRYNYIIKATYTEDEKMYDDLRERYDSLMKYLSI